MFRFAFGVLFSLLWSSAFIAGKYMVLRLPPLDGLSLRFLLAGVLIFIISFIMERGSLVHWRCKTLWVHGLILALFNYVLYLGWSYTGLQTVSPELVVLLVSTMPFVTTFVVSLIARRWLWLQWVAILLGFIGVYVVLSTRMPHASFSIGVIWTVLGMLALAAGTLFYQFKAHDHRVLPLTGVQNLLAGLILLLVSTPSQWMSAMSEPVFAISVWYQVIVVSVIAMLMWFYLVRWFGSAKASAFHLLNPIFAAVLAWWFFDVSLGLWDMVGTLMVIGALGLLHQTKHD